MKHYEQTKVYVFAGKFHDIDEAFNYAHPQWNEKSAFELDYNANDDEEPIHLLLQNIDADLDSDFIEASEIRISDLQVLQISEYDIEIRRSKLADANYFVLVYEQAFGGICLIKEPKSTNKLSYLGVYDCYL